MLTTVASTGEGVDELLDELDRHRDWAAATGTLRDRRLLRAGREIEAITVTALRERLGDLDGGDRLAALAADVVDGKLDPYAAADELLAALTA